MFKEPLYPYMLLQMETRELTLPSSMDGMNDDSIPALKLYARVSRVKRLDRTEVESFVDRCLGHASDADADTTTTTTISRVDDRVVLDDAFEGLRLRYLDAFRVVVDPANDILESDETVAVDESDLYVGIVVVTSSIAFTSSSGRYENGRDDARSDGGNATSIATNVGSGDENVTSIETYDGRDDENATSIDGTDVVGVDWLSSSMIMSVTR